MKFVIEIYGTAEDGSETLLHRATITAFSPVSARKEVSFLLSNRKNATGAHVLNVQGETLYKLLK